MLEMTTTILTLRHTEHKLDEKHQQLHKLNHLFAANNMWWIDLLHFLQYPFEQTAAKKSLIRVNGVL